MSRPGVFGLPHLSEDAVAAYADGVLSATAADRAQRHCAECAECAAAVRTQREAVMLLRGAQAPTLPEGLLARLTGLPMSAPLPPSHRGLPTALGPDGRPVLMSKDPSSQRPSASESDSDADGAVSFSRHSTARRGPSVSPLPAASGFGTWLR